MGRSIQRNQMVNIFSKASSKGVYVSRSLVNKDQFIKWCKDQGFQEINSDLHVTIAYSRKHFINVPSTMEQIIVTPAQFTSIEILGDATVLRFTSNQFYTDHKDKIAQGAIYDYPLYTTHISISYSHQFIDCPLPDFDLVFGEEIEDELNENYIEEVTTASIGSIVPIFR